MKPRTKLQHEIFDMSERLPSLTPKQNWWAFENCMKHVGYRTKKGISCLDCGHQWAGSQTDTVAECPCCGTTLQVETTKKKRLFHGKRYMAILDMIDGYQVVRIFQMWASYRAGERVDFTIWEIIQQFHGPDGRVGIVARFKPFSYRDDAWGGHLECRGNNNWESKYDVWPDKIYPEYTIRDEYRQRGFDGDISNVCASPYQVWRKLEHDNKAETLIKIGQHDVLSWYVGRENNRIYRYWNTLKICFRHGYCLPTENLTSYLDYLDLLEYFDKDLRNPVFVCPADFATAHSKYVAKKRADDRRSAMERERREIERNRKQLEIDSKKYTECKGVYFGLAFSKANITVKVLESVMEFIEESDIHKHCIFTNKYYNKAESLCFTAIVDGVRTETIEVSLTDFKIVQSRGAHNGYSKHHQAIMELMEKNLHKIKKRHKEATMSISAAA